MMTYIIKFSAEATDSNIFSPVSINIYAIVIIGFQTLSALMSQI